MLGGINCDSFQKKIVINQYFFFLLIDSTILMYLYFWIN